jgi:hypothetical protein
VALGLVDLYAFSKNPDNLNEAISAYREAIDLMLEQSPEQITVLNNLGIRLV